jgi:outer membrane protein OmpA-like peptidoglycan-associated protein
VVEEAPVAAAAATAETDATAAEVVTEELTDADVRSSNEDFTTTVTGTAAPQTETTTQNRDKGLSNFEKALLLGLGAVVVGSVLNNGDEVVSNSGDRVVVQRGDELRVLKNDDVLLRQPGSEIATETFSDGSTRTTITRADGTQIVTIRSNDGRVLRRARVMPDGSQVALFDDTVAFAPVDVTTLPAAAPQQVAMSSASDSALRDALLANLLSQPDRTFSLDQVREIRQVRTLAPQVELDTVTFASGSAAIDPSQAEQLGTLGRAISAIVVDNPNTVFLIEGHTDAVGAASYNLALSDRRAETVALALTEYFGVPPENLITQGYGEEFLKIDTQADERANRRAAVRNITSLLR